MSPHVTFWRPLEGNHSSGCRLYNTLQWSFLLCAASQNRQAIPNLPNNPEAFGNLWDQPAPIGMQCTVCAARAKARKGMPRVSTASHMPQRCRTLPADFARLLMLQNASWLQPPVSVLGAAGYTRTCIRCARTLSLASTGDTDTTPTRTTSSASRVQLQVHCVRDTSQSRGPGYHDALASRIQLHASCSCSPLPVRALR